MKLTAAFTLLCCALTACSSTTAGKLTHSVPVSDKFAAGALNWDEGLGSYAFLWGVTELDGEILVCGVGKYSSDRAKTVTQEVMRRARAELDGTPILTNLSFFAEVDAGADLRKQAANCSRTGVPVLAGPWEVTLHSPGGQFNTRNR